MPLNTQAKKREKFISFIFAILTVILLAIFYLDRQAIIEILSKAQWWTLILPLLFMLIAYISFTLSFHYSHKLFALNLPFKFEFVVNYMTLAIGNLMDWGGVVGYSMRASMLQAKGIKFSDSIAASLFQTYFAFFLLLLMLPFALIRLILTRDLNPESENIITTSVLLGFVGSFLLASLVFIKKWRDLFMGWLSFATKKVLKKDIKTGLNSFSNTLELGVNNIKKKPLQFTFMIISLLLGWIGAILIIWSAFKGLGLEIDISVLLVGFIIGMIVTNFAFIPGGFGVQEGSMAGTFALFGVDLRAALLVTLIFRVIYYFIPNFVSLILYWTGYRAYVNDD